MGKDYHKLGVGDIGYHAPRSCTDVWASILLIIFWVFMLVLAGAGFKHGHFRAVVYGSDFTGQPCSGGDKLWYPIQYSASHHLFQLTQAKMLGVCVPACPTVHPGASPATYVTTHANTSSGIPAQWQVLYNTSTVILGRCVPDFTSFYCNSIAQCIAQRAGQKGAFNTMLGFGGFLDSGIELLKEKIGVIVGLSILCIVVSFLWLFALRVLVKPLVAITAVALFVFGLLCGILMMHFSKEALSGSSSQKWYLAGAIICWIVTFLYACLLAFLFKDLIAACDIIEEASRVPVEMKRIVIVPVVISIFIFAFAAFQAACAIAIHTAGDYHPTTVSIAGQTKVMQTQEFVAKNWRTIGIWYDLFMFLWSMGFLHAICHMVIGMCAVLWYWSTPGEHKEPPTNTLSWSIGTTFRYHLGTLALGSFLIALVQFLRILFRVFEKRLTAVKEASTAARMILCCVDCCLSCFERVISLLTKDAYILTCITGEGLLPAARQAVGLLMGNRAAVAVNILGEIILIIGKVLITAFITVVAWLSVKGDAYSTNILFIVVVALTAYFISSVFATVFSCCIDAVVMCYCVDKEENNGQDKPYYFPEALNQHVEAHHQRQLQKGGGNGGFKEQPPVNYDRPTSGYGGTEAPMNSQGYGQI